MPTNSSPRLWITIALSSALAFGTFVCMPVAQAQAPYNANLYSGLKWRMLGPFRGGRVDAVSGVPGRPNEFYFGAVNGGVWKTIDAGFAAGCVDWRARRLTLGARYGLRRDR